MCIYISIGIQCVAVEEEGEEEEKKEKEEEEEHRSLGQLNLTQIQSPP